jgi:hypothetical protein
VKHGGDRRRVHSGFEKFSSIHVSPLSGFIRQLHAATHRVSLVTPSSDAANLKIGELDSVVDDPSISCGIKGCCPGAAASGVAITLWTTGDARL